MNQYQWMFFVNFDCMRKIPKILNKILISFLHDSQANIGFNTIGIELNHSRKAGSCHFVLFKVEETVPHSNSCLDWKRLKSGECLFIILKRFDVVSFKEADLGQSKHCDKSSLVGSGGILTLNDSIEHVSSLP